MGKPTAVQTASAGNAPPATAVGDRAPEAKMSLQTAVDLNAGGDASCAAAVRKTRGLLQKG